MLEVDGGEEKVGMGDGRRHGYYPLSSDKVSGEAVFIALHGTGFVYGEIDGKFELKGRKNIVDTEYAFGMEYVTVEIERMGFVIG